MAKRKQPFIRKKQRPDPEIKLSKKIGDLTIRELSEILGLHESKPGKSSENLIGGYVKRVIDKAAKDYKDHKDLIYEGPLIIKGKKKQSDDLPGLLDELIKKISGLEKEVKALKQKKK